MGSKPKTLLSFVMVAATIWSLGAVAAAPVADAGVPARQIALGTSMLPDRDLNALDQFTASIGGRAPALWSVWSSWGIPNGAFDTTLYSGLRQRNITPLVIWQPDDPSNPSDPRFAYSRIAAGDWDTYLRDYATAAKAWGSTIVMRFAHEMDGDWFPWGMGRFDNTPATFIAAWRHVVDIFRGSGGVGATNVKFLWSPYLAAPTLYPGDAYVDYVGFTRFNWGPPKTSLWRPLKDLLTGAVKDMAAITSRPIIVAETGSANWSAGDKAAWIRDGYAAAYDNFPSIKAIMYFNINVSGYDWRLTNPPAALSAYAAIAADPRFQGTMDPPAPGTSVTYASDSFNRTVTDSWGSAGTGGAYTLLSTAADYDVAGGVGTISVAASGNRSAVLTGAAARDVDLSFRVASNKPTAGAAQFVYGVARRVSSTSEYRIRLRMPPNGNALIQATSVVGNAETALGTEVRVPGADHTAGAFIRVRAEVTGSNPTTINIRAWADGTAEPSGWQYSVTDSAAALQVSGGVGVRAYLSSATSNGPVLFSFDDLQAASLGSAPPPPPPSNGAPSATLSLSPTNPTTNQTLTATVTPSDPDGDAVSLVYNWKVNGVSVRATSWTAARSDSLDLAVPGNGNAGDVISVDVTPNDGKVNGSTATSSVTVAANPGSVVVYADDAFGRSVTNSWGSAATGGVYTLLSTAADYDVTGAAGTIVLAAGGNRSAVLLGASALDVDLSFRVATDRIGVVGAQFVYGVARRVSTTSEYRIKLRLPPNGTALVQASSVMGNVETALGTEVLVAGLAHSAGGFIRVRAQVSGANPTTIRIRAWADGAAEPTTWQYTVVDSTAGLQAAGPVGVRAYMSSSTTNGPTLFSFDDFRATSIEP
jgi:hypothetical protein